MTCTYKPPAMLKQPGGPGSRTPGLASQRCIIASRPNLCTRNFAQPKRSPCQRPLTTRSALVTQKEPAQQVCEAVIVKTCNQCPPRSSMGAVAKLGQAVPSSLNGRGESRRAATVHPMLRRTNGQRWIITSRRGGPASWSSVQAGRQFLSSRRSPSPTGILPNIAPNVNPPSPPPQPTPTSWP